MSADLPPDVQAELLDDFYSEADEHLNSIRDSLVLLEASLGSAQIDRQVTEKLLRSFHSFKGICGIVGLRAAETLAHRTEDVLRGLSRATTQLSREVLDLLMSATHRLEQVVRAHHDGRPLPEVESLLQRLSAPAAPLVGVSPSATSGPAVSASLATEIDVARARGAVIWRCAFSPKPELDQRGVNLTSVRARLGAIGQILSVIPEVQPGGSVVFEFVVALRDTVSDLGAWERDGLTFRPLDHGDEGPAARAPEAYAPLVDPEATYNPFVAPSHVVRVDLSRLDDLMRMMGELVIHRSRLDDQITRAARGEGALRVETLDEVNTSLARSLRDLREGIMRVRLVPVAEIFSRMPFVVRDLAREMDKKVQLTLSGQQTEIDKFLVERLKDPLLHLVRNAVSHGIEPIQERVAVGKSESATIALRARAVGDSVLIEIEDDGRGVDTRKVAACAKAQGLKVPETLDDASVLNLLCAPGFSTKEEADRAAGRGVGMAVVNNAVRELGGTLSMQSTRGQGTRFVLRVPLTLAIAEAFIVSSADQNFAVPQTFVHEIVQMPSEELHRVNETELMPYRDSVLPLFRLDSLWRRVAAKPDRSVVLVLSSERGSVGLVVDRVHGQREVVVRSMRDPLINVPGIAGATELGDGQPVLILDAAALTEGVARPHTQSATAAATVSIATSN